MRHTWLVEAGRSGTQEGKVFYSCDSVLPPVPPTIRGSSGGSEVTAVLGSHKVLLCEAEGTPDPRITWLKDGRPIVSSPQFTYTQGGHTLRVAGVRREDTGTYTCRASSPAGTALAHYMLSILGKTDHQIHFKVPESAE